MGLISAFNGWITTRYENRIARMKDEKKCPECNGRGFLIYPATEYAFHGNLDCPGCEGSGQFTDWYNSTE